MEDAASQGIGSLLNYGAVGAMLVLSLLTIYFLNRQNAKTMKMVLEGRDRETEIWKKQAKETQELVTVAIDGISANTTRLVDLFESQKQVIDYIPKATAKEIQLINARKG